MGFSINPLQFLIFPFLFLVALPVALCAGFTTILAFFVLFIRLFLVYFDVGLETLHFLFTGNATLHSRTPSSSLSSSPLPSPNATHSRTKRHRRRKSSTGSGTATGSITPVGGSDNLALTPSIGLERDFEGLGGWRLDSADGGADTADDKQWYNLNSRLELPDHRHHSRSQSGGTLLPGSCSVGPYTRSGVPMGTLSPEALRMTTSPNSSRLKLHDGSTKLDNDDSYFPPCEGKHAKAKTA
ncbi:hypothetical protein F4810DRAFT_653300 [Camillea tinctor]|nr:hypothetical protein F4810DRAFT_653300 [Camillea tinctor]